MSSRILIQEYLNQLRDLRAVSGTKREMVVREAFKDLLKASARAHDLIFVAEYEVAAPTKERRYVDGALLYSLRVPFGYWEAKDEKDDLDAEIQVKFSRGYPQDNIIFEDSQQAILIQNKCEIIRCPVDDVDRLGRLLDLFFEYQRPEIAQFGKAVEQFKTDLPAVLESLRAMIEKAEEQNPDFHMAVRAFLTHACEVINPQLTAADVREMLIQHILTEEVFAAVFPGTPFHSDNNVARELYKLEGTFFTGNTKFATLKALEPYYAAIRSAAAQISRHNEKQAFLKVIYENFYKVYNPKAADRLGVIYTPNEIVRFMVESADWLCEKQFRRGLIDSDVDILDPAAGTGTFICELMEHFRGQPAKLTKKYLHELHANEVAILPYYVANLNIEATYAAITGEYIEYPNLCFVDTLDNTYALRKHSGHMDDLFGAVSDINVRRIRKQNSRRISVIIGNPPYNANQLNENENNKNREYPEIDKRIKETYIAASTAQKTKQYDMYVRFARWASDRVDENGIVALVTNNSLIAKRNFDGFRKCIASEFNEIWIVDLKGDARTSGEQRRREGGNVFNDQIRVGVAVYFLVRKKGTSGCRIFYDAVRDYAKSDEKREYLASKPLRDRTFAEIRPSTRHDWLNQVSNDFDSLIPVATKEAKAEKRTARASAIFRLFSLGVVTNRDDWVYDLDARTLAKKVGFLIEEYNRSVRELAAERGSDNLASMLSPAIKWTRAVKNDLRRGTEYQFDADAIIESLYRPFCKRRLYFSRQLNEMQYRLSEMFGANGRHSVPTIVFTDPTSQKPFMLAATTHVYDLHLVGAAAGSVGLPYQRLTSQGETVDNITDWALDRFRKHYQPGREKESGPITKEAIFGYVYGVLHDPSYHEKYAQNLKRDLPRVPLYSDFWQWSAWGKELMDLHIGYETAAPFMLERLNVPYSGLYPKPMLKANKEAGLIILDSETTLRGVPASAWGYRLGNRSALEWILDQYQQKKPKDPTIREKFNTYRFADHKEKVIDLLARVVTVSVETQRIVGQMRQAGR